MIYDSVQGESPTVAIRSLRGDAAPLHGRSSLADQIQCDRGPSTAVNRADPWRIYMRPHMIHEACVTE